LYVYVHEQAFVNVPAISDCTIRRDIAAGNFTTGPDINAWWFTGILIPRCGYCTGTTVSPQRYWILCELVCPVYRVKNVVAKACMARKPYTIN